MLAIDGNYQCQRCGQTFIGRTLSEDSPIFCSECRKINVLPIINKGDTVPNSVLKEFALGGGENGEN